MAPADVLGPPKPGSAANLKAWQRGDGPLPRGHGKVEAQAVASSASWSPFTVTVSSCSLVSPCAPRRRSLASPSMRAVVLAWPVSGPRLGRGTPGANIDLRKAHETRLSHRLHCGARWGQALSTSSRPKLGTRARSPVGGGALKDLAGFSLATLRFLDEPVPLPHFTCIRRRHGAGGIDSGQIKLAAEPMPQSPRTAGNLPKFV